MVYQCSIQILYIWSYDIYIYMLFHTFFVMFHDSFFTTKKEGVRTEGAARGSQQIRSLQGNSRYGEFVAEIPLFTRFDTSQMDPNGAGFLNHQQYVSFCFENTWLVNMKKLIKEKHDTMSQYCCFGYSTKNKSSQCQCGYDSKIYYAWGLEDLQF